MFITCWTFNVHYLFTLFVKQGSGENFVKLYWIYDIFNKQMINFLSTINQQLHNELRKDMLG